MLCSNLSFTQILALLTCCKSYNLIMCEHQTIFYHQRCIKPLFITYCLDGFTSAGRAMEISAIYNLPEETIEA